MAGMNPSPSLLDAIAEVCKWHGRILASHPSRVLRDGGRQEILPPEIPQAIRRGEIEVPEELRVMIFNAVFDADFKDWPAGALNRPIREFIGRGTLETKIDPVVTSREIE